MQYTYEDVKIFPKIKGIYKITNIKNNKKYVGSTFHKLGVKGRWRNHIYELEHNVHKNAKLQNAWNKYEKNNFVFEILEEITQSEILLLREQNYIDTLKPFYNISPMANRSLVSFETKQKMSESHRGKNSKLDKTTVLDVKNDLNNGMAPITIIKKYNNPNITINVVNHISHNRTWQHIGVEIKSENRFSIKGENNRQAKLTTNEVIKIKKLLKVGLTQAKIAKKFNVSPNNIGCIKRNETWSHILT